MRHTDKSIWASRRYRLAAMIVCLMAPLVAAGDALPEHIVANCRICHAGSALAIPDLRGLAQPVLLQNLLDFKYERRPSTLMSRIAKGYSDAELAAVADYLSRNESPLD